MRGAYLIHILAGGAALTAGYVALYSTKGAPLHRRAGLVFVWTMLTMCAAGFVMTVVRNVAPAGNIPAALLTAALVVTALTTVRPVSPVTRRLDLVATACTAGVALACTVFAIEAFANGGRGRHGFPAFPFVMFGTVGLLATIGDLRVLYAGPLRGAERVARHLWRMSFALFIAALSFFIGQSDEFPRALRIMPLLALPVLAVLVTMLYWLWRVRIRRSLRGLATA